MKTLGRIWKIILAVLLLAGAAYVWFGVYMPASEEHTETMAELATEQLSLTESITTNAVYESVQEDIEAAAAEIEESREELYAIFPTEIKEEDQLMYLVYLEELFGLDVHYYEFTDPVTVYTLNDGAVLKEVTMTIEYTISYETFKEMLDYIASDSKVVSIQYCLMGGDYITDSDLMYGDLTVVYYIIQSDLQDEYSEPETEIPETGKENIFS